MTELARALNIAVEAAREAGALIRADFHLPGGPRGHGDHAEVDVEAERLIRARLTAAFPTWGYTGEETGRGGPAAAATWWLVDPNDGTSAYLRGYRGSAVSIALIAGGLPVLGVVFAPLAPDDDGDLIAWTQGQPLTRNGAPFERSPLPDTLGPQDVVFVSQAADAASVANAELCAPARFRAMPSIAYRLALVAAGDGEAAVSLNGPGDWDYAAGHALLRAVGGDLVDQHGAPVRYRRELSSTRWCIGGAPKPATALAGRDWNRAHLRPAPDPTEAAYPLVRPERGHAIAGAAVLARAQGCLLGQLAGDALGSLVEFRSAESIRRRYPGGVRDMADGGTWETIAGQPTDDSEMALILARSLVRAGGWSHEPVRAAYRAWYDSRPFDIGNTTRQGLTGRPNPDSQANGSLMRISPLGIWGHALAAGQLATIARADSAITHPNAVCGDATAAFTVAVAHAIGEGDGPAGAHAAALRWCDTAGAEPAVTAALRAAETEPPADYLTNAGWVLVALQNAFYQLLHAPALEAGVVASVMAGGDTDTTAAIAGALLGAVYGRRAVPARWQRAVLTCRPIATLPGVHRPRPRPFWPVDALELAERLLVAGSATSAATTD